MKPSTLPPVWSQISGPVVSIAVGHRGHLHQFRACQTDHVLFFLALGFRDHDHRFEPHGRPHQRQTDARVARRALDNRATRFQIPARNRVANDEQRRAVLDRLAGVQEFSLAVDVTARRL